MSALRQRWDREMFDPGWMGWIVNPFVLARRGLSRELRDLLSRLNGDVVDIGCGRKPYRSWIDAERYLGIDLDTPTTRALAAADLLYDGKRLPLADASHDGALCSQVLEHVPEPDDFVAEIRRVLRPGGLLVLTVPFAWDEHEQPNDFARYSSFGLRVLLERNGFEVLELRKSGRGAAAIAQLASGLLFRLTRTRRRPLNLLAQLTLIAPVNLAGGLASLLLPSSAEIYLDNVVLARKRPATVRAG